MKLFTVFILLWGTAAAMAQVQPNPIDSSTVIRIYCGSKKTKFENPPLFVINDRKVIDQGILDLLNADDIEELTVLKKDDGIKAYGTRAEYGVIKIRLKKKVKLIGMQELLTRLKVNSNNRQLQLYVNEEKIKYPDQFFVGTDWVKAIEVNLGPTDKINEVSYLSLIKK